MWNKSVTSSDLSVQRRCSGDEAAGVDGKQRLVVDELIMDLTVCPQIWIGCLNQETKKTPTN